MLPQAPGKTPDLLLVWLAKSPGVSIPALAQELGKSESAIDRTIRKLRADGKLARISALPRAVTVKCLRNEWVLREKMV
ncbi:HTH domain-containing protein [Polaromonas sp. UBA4122]|uniref:HTH domain-containing protein n=1 Tax=Polaromonas sp. UBA4122 TaxID=1947074 RepID=UPI0025FB4B94|nr:HTH domain-containing protein [Polaromonas sp. UBA4122]